MIVPLLLKVTHITGITLCSQIALDNESRNDHHSKPSNHNTSSQAITHSILHRFSFVTVSINQTN